MQTCFPLIIIKHLTPLIRKHWEPTEKWRAFLWSISSQIMSSADSERCIWMPCSKPIGLLQINLCMQSQDKRQVKSHSSIHFWCQKSKILMGTWWTSSFGVLYYLTWSYMHISCRITCPVQYFSGWWELTWHFMHLSHAIESHAILHWKHLSNKSSIIITDLNLVSMSSYWDQFLP